MSVNSEERRSRLAYIWAREKGRCFWCDMGLVRPSGPGDNRPNLGTADHIQTQSRGGSHLVKNLVLACTACNSRRGSTSAEQWAGRLGMTRKLKRFLGGDYAAENHDRVMSELYASGVSPPVPPRSRRRRFVPR